MTLTVNGDPREFPHDTTLADLVTQLVPSAKGVAAAVNGHLSGKLSDLGLSTSQADAVLALSREVVERIVWEVVPQLAEALIKEEIQRLTRA